MATTLDRNAAGFSINGRSLASLAIPELLALRKDLEWRVARAEGAG